MNILRPTNSTDPTCPVSSDSFWDNDGNFNDNSHMHDNRYYTKDEIDNKLNHILDSNRPISILRSGNGLIFFEFDGTKDVDIYLDFEDSLLSPTVGVSNKPARFDHYHQNLINGIGIKQFVYTGLNTSTVSIDFDSNGTTTKVSRADHAHKILSTGAGLILNSYDATAEKIFSVNFGIELGNKYGTSDIVSRADHYHFNLSAGNGLIYSLYNGSENIDFSVSYGGHGDDWGTDVSVSRSNHTHNKLYADKTNFEDKSFVHVENRNTSLIFKNIKDEDIASLIVKYAEIANKLENEKLITLQGSVIGSVLFDGSKDVTIETTTGPLSESTATSNSIKKITGDWLITQSNEYISFIYDDNNKKLIIENLSANKFIEPINFVLSGDISASFSFDGSNKNMNIPLIISSDGIIKVKDLVSSMFDFSNIDDKYIKVQYDSVNQKISFLNTDIFKTNKHNIPTENKVYDLGSLNNRFSVIYSDSIDCNILNCNIINVEIVEKSNWAFGVIVVDDDKIEIKKFAEDICFTNHMHLNSNIQPDIVFLNTGFISTHINFLNQRFEGEYSDMYFSYEKMLTKYAGTPEHIDMLNKYPKSFTYNLFNANWNTTNFDYTFKWTVDFDNDIYIKESFNIMTLSDKGDLWIKKDLTVDGNLIIKGTSFTVNSEEVSITDNYLILNFAETGSSVTRGEAGFIFERGTSENYKIVFKESTGDLEIGFESNLKKIPTIKRNITNNSLLVWNSLTNDIDNSSITYINDSDSLIFNKNNNILKFLNKNLYINDKKLIDQIELIDNIYTKIQIDDFFEGTSTYNKKIIDWSNVSNKPTQFIPITHNHDDIYEKCKKYSSVIAINANSSITYNIIDIFGKLIDPSFIFIDIKVNDMTTTDIISANLISHYTINNGIIKIFNNYNENLTFRVLLLGFNG